MNLGYGRERTQRPQRDFLKVAFEFENNEKQLRDLQISRNR